MLTEIESIAHARSQMNRTNI